MKSVLKDIHAMENLLYSMRKKFVGFLNLTNKKVCNINVELFLQFVL